MKEGLWVEKVPASNTVYCLESVAGKWRKEEVKYVFTCFISQDSVQPMYECPAEKIIAMVHLYNIYFNSVHF